MYYLKTSLLLILDLGFTYYPTWQNWGKFQVKLEFSIQNWGKLQVKLTFCQVGCVGMRAFVNGCIAISICNDNHQSLLTPCAGKKLLTWARGRPVTNPMDPAAVADHHRLGTNH